MHVLAATSEGELIRNGRLGEKHRRVVGGHARALAAATVKDAAGRCLNRSEPKRRAAVKRLARAKEREANARLDGLHKSARRLVDSADVIASVRSAGILRAKVAGEGASGALRVGSACTPTSTPRW